MFDLVACKFFVLKVYTVYLLAHFFVPSRLICVAFYKRIGVYNQLYIPKS